MKLIKSIALVSLTASLLIAQGQGKKKDEALQSVVNTGKQSSKLLLKTLGSNMKKNMKAGGPMKALDFCSQEAYNLTEKVNKELPKGVTVKRISMKYRNPANKPEADEAAVLEALAKLKNANVILPKQVVQKVSADTYKYYKPLVINKKVCLKCHGDIQNVALKRAIEERYPMDKATHYKMGDLRGAVVVTIKK
ncbi:MULTISPECIES: DUF3365 domain-containing protein [Sulfurimonas]|uniref:Tll0287-like domain-containing protein n=1 Tax=Sulfurimonas TaxID=202746 RepID=UPI0012650DA5|nr:DUF3365 domain-containing protein [Sulfurimonas indica]